MKLRIENSLLWLGSAVSLLIIYLTKIDTTPAANQWVYDLGQYFWFNLSISYLSSVIFYLIVVYIPERKKRKIFKFRMGMDIQMLYFKGLKFFFHLRNAAEMRDELKDTGKIEIKDIGTMIDKIDFDKIYLFENEEGFPRQTFKDYLDKYSVDVNNAIIKALSVPYDDSILSLKLLELQRESLISGTWKALGNRKFSKLDILGLFIELKCLDCYFKQQFADTLFPARKNGFKIRLDKFRDRFKKIFKQKPPKSGLPTARY